MTETDMQPGGADRQPIVRLVGDQLRADSRDVAAYFRKDHKNVLQAITNLHCSPRFRGLNFQPFKINDLTGETTSHVTMTKDGFAFLVMGFTGPAAAVFKEAYIERFNAMEAELRNRAAAALPQTFAEALRLAADKAEENERLSGQVRQQAERIAFQAPKVEAYKRIAEADGSMCITEAAKNLQLRPTDLFKHLRTRAWIYRRAGAREDLGY